MALGPVFFTGQRFMILVVGLSLSGGEEKQTNFLKVPTLVDLLFFEHMLHLSRVVKQMYSQTV